MNTTSLSSLLEAFFNQRLKIQKKVSPHTLASYSTTFQLLFEYAKKRLRKTPAHLTLNDLNAQFLSKFLDDLEKQRKISVRTRNLRLTALKSFFKFLSYKLPEMNQFIMQVLALPEKRSVKKLIDFLNVEEVDVLLSAPNQAKWLGRRDYVLLLIAIQTGARLSELLGLKWKDVDFEGSYIECLGKGRKERRIPLTIKSRKCLQAWFLEVSNAPNDVVFPTIHGKKMSSDAFQYLVKKYVGISAKKCPSLLKKKITPHVLRHTSAMRLVQSGIELSSIALCLGHESISTTYGYLNADMEMKEKVFKKLLVDKSKLIRYKSTDKTIKFLKNLTSFKE